VKEDEDRMVSRKEGRKVKDGEKVEEDEGR
jgi:hypothetical protein